jgi:hypothetical protein
MAARGLATAEWVPRLRSLREHANFTFGDAFFGLDDDTKTAVLLHESVHVRLYRGRLRNNYLVIRTLNRCPNIATPFRKLPRSIDSQR